MTAADKPRADLVALFDAFAASAPAYSSLQLHGDAAAEALLAWGHGARTERRERADGTAWTVAAVDLPNRVWIVAHFDREPAAQADQQVLARVQAAVNGFRCSVCNAPLRGPVGAQCPLEHLPIGYAIAKEQPEAAEGSV